MAELHIKSNDLKLFPCTKRGSFQRSARLFSEENTTKLVNNLLDTNGFMITTDTNSIPVEFNIFGYYFSIANMTLNDIGSKFNDSTSIYAYITLDGITINDIYTNYEIQYFDVRDPNSSDENPTYYYNGLTFTDEMPTGDSKVLKYIKILEKNDENEWQVPKSSLAKFNFTSIKNFNIDRIDGGEIE